MSATFANPGNEKNNNLSKLKKAMGIRKKYHVIFTASQDMDMYIDATSHEEATKEANKYIKQGYGTPYGPRATSVYSVEETAATNISVPGSSIQPSTPNQT